MDRQSQVRNTPTDDQKAALRGSHGVPSAANRFVTQSDPALGSVEAHASTHVPGGVDVVEYFPVLASDPAAALGSPSSDAIWFIRNGTSPETISVRACIDGIVGTVATWTAP